MMTAAEFQQQPEVRETTPLGINTDFFWCFFSYSKLKENEFTTSREFFLNCIFKVTNKTNQGGDDHEHVGGKSIQLIINQLE